MSKKFSKKRLAAIGSAVCAVVAASPMAFAEEGNASSAVITAVSDQASTISTSASTMISTVVPYAIGITVAFILFKIGNKLLKKVGS